MKNMLQTAGARTASATRAIRNRSRGLVLAAVTTAMVGSAHAQTTPANEGVAQVKSALDALKPDLSFIVTAAVLVALVGIGAGVALALGKKLMGK